ncbi:hypothetical protein Glove_87g239 [Diversispora epigaea]|uniref:Uncharacterized protein n=1 Tax=Diversispora epigaea TaxID=1348612 RepID=A0A397J8I2_9GLOM|nr:hypothetical protein Glove_87g239 [Diversispora epigaea]
MEEWGIVKNPTLLTNLEEWSKEDFLTLKTTSQQCLPLIHITQHMAIPDQPIKSNILTERWAMVSLNPLKKLEKAIWNESKVYHDKNVPQFGDFYIRSNEHDFNLSKFNNRYEKPITSSSSDYFSIIICEFDFSITSCTWHTKVLMIEKEKYK